MAIRRALVLVARAVESGVPILLEGETGTGKELLARAIHAEGKRRGLPSSEPLSLLMERVELALIQERLRATPTKAAAARNLGITREALYAKLRRLAVVRSYVEEDVPEPCAAS